MNARFLSGVLNRLMDVKSVLKYYEELKYEDRDVLLKMITEVYSDNTLETLTPKEAIEDYKATLKYDRREANASFLKYLLVLSSKGYDTNVLINTIKGIEEKTIEGDGSSNLVESKATARITNDNFEELLKHYHSYIVAAVKDEIQDYTKSLLEKSEKEKNIDNIMLKIKDDAQKLKEDIINEVVKEEATIEEKYNYNEEEEEEEEEEVETEYEDPKEYEEVEEKRKRTPKDLLFLHISRFISLIVCIFISFICSFIGLNIWIVSIITFILLNGVVFSYLFHGVLRPKSTDKMKECIQGTIIFSANYLLCQLISYSLISIFLIPVFTIVSYYIFRTVLKPQVKFDTVGNLIDISKTVIRKGGQIGSRRKYKESYIENRRSSDRRNYREQKAYYTNTQRSNKRRKR